MYCHAHKTATLTPIQHTVRGSILLLNFVRNSSKHFAFKRPSITTYYYILGPVNIQFLKRKKPTSSPLFHPNFDYL